MARAKGQSLGKGLGALIPQLNVGPEDAVSQIPIDELRPNPYQPRREFAEEKLAELVESVREHGILQPLIVRQGLSGYEIVAGERRFRAAKRAGLSTVPAVVRDLTDRQVMEIALIENLQREDLNPIEIAEAYATLMKEFSLTQEMLAERVGQSRSHVANMLRLLNLPPEVREHVSRGTLSMGHARALLSLNDPEQQRILADRIAKDDLSVRAVEQMVHRLTAVVSRETRRPSKTENPTLRYYEDALRESLGTAVKIQQGKKRGRIEIEYYSEEDLARLLHILAPDLRL
ncbi:MAG: ParB/RepB/Spo0J family partition protein [Alicyclobacillaceae bacterium]|nr:ParB/RepB/Spo0J family partition protein [Alicyclobacillaceae bacterium]